MSRLAPVSSTTLFLILALLSSSCGKKGCTDELAQNYDESAKRDDGSCTFAPVIEIQNASNQVFIENNRVKINFSIESKYEIVTAYCTSSSSTFIGSTYFTKTFNPPISGSIQQEIELLNQSMVGDHTFFIEAVDEMGNKSSKSFGFQPADTTRPEVTLEIQYDPPPYVLSKGELNFFTKWHENYGLKKADVELWDLDAQEKPDTLVFRYVEETYTGGLLDSLAKSGSYQAYNYGVPIHYPLARTQGLHALVIRITDLHGNVNEYQSESFQAQYFE